MKKDLATFFEGLVWEDIHQVFDTNVYSPPGMKVEDYVNSVW